MQTENYQLENPYIAQFQVSSIENRLNQRLFKLKFSLDRKSKTFFLRTVLSHRSFILHQEQRPGKKPVVPGFCNGQLGPEPWETLTILQNDPPTQISHEDTSLD